METLFHNLIGRTKKVESAIDSTFFVLLSKFLSKILSVACIIVSKQYKNDAVAYNTVNISVV